MNKSIVGMNIKAARKKQKMTQKELAELIGYSESSICKYEQGLVEIPMIIIEKIASVLHVPSSELFDLESWEDEFNSVNLSKEIKAFEAVDSVFGKDSCDFLKLFLQLNKEGQKKAIERIYEMTELPKYQK